MYNEIHQFQVSRIYWTDCIILMSLFILLLRCWRLLWNPLTIDDFVFMSRVPEFFFHYIQCLNFTRLCASVNHLGSSSLRYIIVSFNM